MSKNFLLLILLLSYTKVAAQNSSSSPYSVYGVGIINDKTTSLNRSLGGTGIAIQDNYNLNALNPASYLSITSPINHVFEFSMYTEHNRYATNTLGYSKTNGGLNNINYWFKFKPWWASTLGLSPYSTVSYEVSTTKTIADNTTGNYQYSGSGNISRLYWGHSFQLFKNFAAGFHLSYLFGSVNRSEAILGSSSTETLVLDNSIFTNKLKLDYGIQYKIPLAKGRSLTLGATFDNQLNLRGESDLTLYTSNGDTLNTQKAKNVHYTLPLGIGSGIAFKTRRSLVAADVVYKQWSKARFSTMDIAFQDTWRTSFGYTYLGNENAESYLEMINLRAGVYVQNHYMIVRNNNILNYGFSTGLGIPVLDGKSTINLTYNFDKFGTKANNLIVQQSQKFMIDIVIRDLWGYRRKSD